jgi:hypothetical protein
VFAVNESRFNHTALELFHWQSKQNEVYAEYLSLINRKPDIVTSIQQIPFLPIELFKTRKVITGEKDAEIVFSSSGTTGMEQSRHYVTEVSVYDESFMLGFKHFYGDPNNYCILALLPGYMERTGSSLIYMVDKLIKAGGHPLSGFFLDDYNELVNRLTILEKSEQKTLLIGVSFALLDLADKYQLQLKHTTVMETGGMKGRRKEITRGELHSYLESRLGVSSIHSEYGMTELLSQAYSQKDGIFHCPPTMKVMTRDINDPFQLLPAGQTGALNIIDLANINSCSFIATSDMGKVYEDGSFEVMGRIDNSDVRGCNLMVE